GSCTTSTTWTCSPRRTVSDHDAAGAVVVVEIGDVPEAGLLQRTPRGGVGDVGRRARLRPRGVATEDDVADEGTDHGGADPAAASRRIGAEVVDPGGRPVHAVGPPLLDLGVAGVVGGGVALDPADVTTVDDGDPVLGGIGVRSAVVA